MTEDSVDIMLNQWSLERPELDTSALSIVVRILTLNKAFLRQATIALKPLSLELWEYDVLSALRRQGAPFELAATELAMAANLSTGAMTNRIDKLQARQLVARRTSPNDRRGVKIRLTASGIGMIDEAIQLRLDAADSGIHGLSRKDRVALAALLRKIVLGSASKAVTEK